MRKLCPTTILIVWLITFLFCQTSFAGDALRKCGRGISNVIFGWIEIPTEISRTGENNPEASSFVTGVFKGFFKAIGRMVVGVYDVVTFPVPVPAHYDPVIEPEFIF